ncbi:Diaminopimelate epimerase-like protein [Auricularia subglabra TFB-10046 SS5]|nr:Diaminopimelate epimerase-like protein [Auricularia subglabra TFB-10046 SS5]
MAHQELQYTVVDAFTSRVFAGNPAAVIVLPSELPDTTLQLIAREFNLSETAFLLPIDGENDAYTLRWFTPTREVPLCGHATLASAHVVFNSTDAKQVTFQTRWSGKLGAVRHDSGKIQLSFPAGIPEAVSEEQKAKVSAVIRKTLGVADPGVEFVGDAPGESYKGYLVVHVDDAIDLASITADTGAVTELAPYGVIIVTNRPSAQLQKEGKHFVSRVFCGAFGIPEDPVTGSAHSMLAPYWVRKLGTGYQVLSARQLSARTGDVDAEWRESEGVVLLRGKAVTAAKGVVYLP